MDKRRVPNNREEFRAAGLQGGRTPGAPPLVLYPDGRIKGPAKGAFFGPLRRPRLWMTHKGASVLREIRKDMGRLNNERWASKKAAR